MENRRRLKPRPTRCLPPVGSGEFPMHGCVCRPHAPSRPVPAAACRRLRRRVRHSSGFRAATITERFFFTSAFFSGRVGATRRHGVVLRNMKKFENVDGPRAGNGGDGGERPGLRKWSLPHPISRSLPSAGITAKLLASVFVLRSIC